MARQKKQQSQSHVVGWLKIILQMSGVGFVICLGYWLWLQITNPHNFPIRVVKIETTYNFVKPKQLRTVVRNNLRGNFFTASVGQLEQGFKSIPWVAKAEVRRSWPAKLTIKLTEQQPIARWNADGVVNVAGKVFYPKVGTIPSGLPQLYGPNNSADEVIDFYQKVNSELKPIKLKATRISLTKRLSWQIWLNDHISVMLGRQQVQQRLLRFIDLYPQLIGKRAKMVEYVDMRYPNGLAIKWKKQK